MKLVMGVFLIMLTGCASVHKNFEAELQQSNGKGNVKVSAEVNDDLSSEYFGMVEFTIENVTGKWLNIVKVEITTPQSGIRDHISFTLGDEFRVWSKAIVKRNRIEQYNSSLAYGAILGVSSAMLASDKPDSQRVGKITGASSLGLLTMANIQEQLKSVQASGSLPEDHLFNTPIKIPPGLFSEAWVLINTDNKAMNDKLTELNIALEYEDASVENFRINIAQPQIDASWEKQYASWQSNISVPLSTK